MLFKWSLSKCCSYSYYSWCTQILSDNHHTDRSSVLVMLYSDCSFISNPKIHILYQKEKKKLSPWLSVRLLCPKLYRRGGGRDYRFSVYSRAVLGKRGICCHDKYWFITFRRVIITCELLSLKACQEKKKKKKKVDAPVCSLFSPLPRRKILAFYECQAISFSHKNGNSSEGEDHFFLVVRFLT